jgi:hypothetical protein
MFSLIAAGVGLDLVPAIETPHDQPHTRRRGAAERHRRAAVSVHLSLGQARSSPKLPRVIVISSVGVMQQVPRLLIDAIEVVLDPGIGAKRLPQLPGR